MEIFIPVIICVFISTICGGNASIYFNTMLQTDQNNSFQGQRLGNIGVKSGIVNIVDSDTVTLLLSDSIKKFSGTVWFICDNPEYISQMVQLASDIHRKIIIQDNVPVVHQQNFINMEQETDDNILYLVFLNYTEHTFSQLASSYRRSQETKGSILFVTSSSDEEYTINELAGSQYYQLFVATPTNSGYQLYEKCAYCNNGNHMIVRINSWSPHTGFEKPLRFGMSFKGTFNAGTVKLALTNSRNGISVISINGTNTYSGSEYDMLLDVAQLLDFNIMIVLPEDGEWGRYKDKKWTGLIGLVHEKAADIAIGVMSINHLRYSVINPTAIIDMEEIGIISARPSREHTWITIFESFTATVWVLTVLSVLLVGFSLFMFHNYSQQENYISFAGALYVPLVVLCSEPFSLQKPNNYTIFVLAIWLFMSTLIISLYTGSLTSLILSPPFSEAPIDSPEDLLRSGRKWMASVGSVDARALDSYPELTKRFEQMSKYSGAYGKVKKILDHSHELTYVANVKKNNIQALYHYLDHADLNPIYVSKDILMSVPNSWMVRKNCPYQKDLTLAIMKIQEVGLLEYYKRKMFLQMRAESLDLVNHYHNHDESIQITFTHFIKMTMVLSVGYLLSLIAFIFERFVTGRILFLLNKRYKAEDMTDTVMKNVGHHGIEIKHQDQETDVQTQNREANKMENNLECEAGYVMKNVGHHGIEIKHQDQETDVQEI